jgi:TolB-like protein/DNA-binding winged helix-turn-helix (wHTH) protein/Flp pilus assembly protein TadD
MASSPTPVRFAEFELDLLTGELRRNGALLKLQPQPARILSILVSRVGEVVTRQDLAREVWGSETFVDFEQGLNFAIRQIRTALDDDPNTPKFLETLPKRGYRFIGEVRRAVAEPGSHALGATLEHPSEPPAPVAPGANSLRRYGAALVAVVMIAVLIGLSWERLRRSTASAGAERLNSVAVLPLSNLSNDSDQEFFSDGITDELITELAKVSNLRVISHTSVQRYKGTKLSLQEIAQQLHADAVIEGSVMRSGDRVRITAQLIDARTDQHLWAEKYDRDFRDILTLQSEVAQQIAVQIGVNLSVGERARLGRTPVVDPAAHEAYLRGRFYSDKLGCRGFKQALEYYEQAEAKDPTFTSALVGISDTYYHLGDWGCSPQAEAFAKSRAAALKAIELDPTLAGAYAQLANLDFTSEWNWPKAESEYAEAIRLDPNDSNAHSSYAIFLAAMGKREQAVAEINKAHEIDPVSEVTNMLDTYVLYLAHQYDSALAQGKKTLELYPNSGATDYWLAQTYEAKGMPQNAFTSYMKTNSGTPVELAGLHTAFEKDGLRGFWLEQFKKSESKPDWPCWQGLFYAHVGDNERALQMLKQSFDQHCDGLQFLKANPVFDPLRDDPRYRELISKLKL